jgi:anti-sigma factor RsiW
MSEQHNPDEKQEFRLSRFLDGELTPDEKAELQADLERDPGLARSLDELGKVDAWVRAARANVPEVDSERFMAEFRRRKLATAAPGRGSLIYRLFRPVAAAAALAIVVAGYWQIRPHTQREEEAETVVVEVTVGPRQVAPMVAPVAIVSFARSDTRQPGRAVQTKETLLVATVGGVSGNGSAVEEEALLF